LFRSISTKKNCLFSPKLSCLDQFLQFIHTDSISTKTVAYFHQHSFPSSFYPISLINLDHSKQNEESNEMKRKYYEEIIN